MPLVSVIIPVYNVAPYLTACLESVINQTYSNLEIILVNDGSTDGSETICKEYVEKDNRILFFDQENIGVAETRLNAFNVSQGQLITFVDGDDYLAPDALRLMIDTLHKTNVDMVSCQFYEVYDEILNKPYPRPEVGFYDKLSIINKLKTNFLYDKKTKIAGVTGYLCGRLIKRKYVKEVLEVGVGMVHSEDQIGILKLLYMINSMFVMKNRLYYYVMRKGQATKVYNSKYWHNFEIYFKKIKEIDVCNYLDGQTNKRAFMMLKMLIKMELGNDHLTIFQRINNINAYRYSNLFNLAIMQNTNWMNSKENLQYKLIKNDHLLIYYILTRTKGNK